MIGFGTGIRGATALALVVGFALQVSSAAAQDQAVGTADLAAVKAYVVDYRVFSSPHAMVSESA